jgi:Domain of unknown function (DUF4189)
MTRAGFTGWKRLPGSVGTFLGGGAFMIGFRRLAAAVAAASLLLAPVSGAHAAGAFAVGACGAYGYAFDYKEAAAARAAAGQKCSGTCKIVGALRRDCAALAVDAKNPCGSYGWAIGAISARRRTPRCAAAISMAGAIVWSAPGPATKRASHFKPLRGLLKAGVCHQLYPEACSRY